MQFTGSELTLKRNFFTQTGYYGFVMSATVDNTSGEYHFGLTGNAGTIDFTLQSGRIYQGSQLLHSYQANQEFVIEGQFSSGANNVLKDNVPLSYNVPKSTGYFDYFYFKRASTALGAEFDVVISGNNLPIYSITNQGYLYSTGQSAVTGWFINQSQFPIKVFDSTIQASANYSFGKLASNVTAANSGAFAYTGDYSTIDVSQPILTSFDTNFGDVSVLFSIVDARSLATFVQLTGPTDFTFNASNVLNRDVSYLNFSGGVVSDSFNTNLTFLLGYVSGSGYFTNLTGYSVPGYGDFQKSGLLTGLVSTITGSWPVTGASWATGAATGFFSGMGTGIVSGIGYTGLGTGYMTGLGTGFIFSGSGTLGIIYPLIGIGISATGTFAPVGQPYTGAFPITITGSGAYVAALTGLHYLPYAKTFTNSWGLATGSSATNLINFVAVSSTLYSGSGLFPPNSYVNMQVTYNTSGTTPDGAYLIVTGAGVINGINQQLSLP